MIKPLYLSKEIFELISLGSEISLHSIFNSSINLKVNNVIVNVSNNNIILPPYGIVLNDEDFRILKYQIEDKQPNFSINKSEISISNIKIDLVGAYKKYESKIKKSNKKILTRNLDSLLQKVISFQKKNGFNIQNNDIIEIVLGKNNFNKQNLENTNILDFNNKLRSLENFFVHGEDYTALKYFIGRGMGLTPSGDDFLVGMMSVFSLYDVFKENIVNIRNFILENKGIYTNDISEQFLILATQNKFSTNIILLLNSLEAKNLDSGAINNVLSYGGTSGVDIILGIIFGIKIINRSDTNE